VYPLFSDLRTSGVVIYPLKSISFLTVFVSKRVHFVKNRGSRMTPLGFSGGLQSSPSLVYVQTPQKQKPPKTSKTDLFFTVFRRKTEKIVSFLAVFGGFRFWGSEPTLTKVNFGASGETEGGVILEHHFCSLGPFGTFFALKTVSQELSRQVLKVQKREKTRKTSKNDPKTLSQGRCYVPKV